MEKTALAHRILALLAENCDKAGAQPEGFGVRGVELADTLQIAWLEAVIAIDGLLDQGLVDFNPGDGIVRLTKEGYAAAKKKQT